jgi:hypothetical protein
MDLLVCVKLDVPADDFAGWQQLMEPSCTTVYDRVRHWYARSPVVQTISHAAPQIVWRGELAIPL